jgi:hypothetical protein
MLLAGASRVDVVLTIVERPGVLLQRVVGHEQPQVELGAIRRPGRGEVEQPLVGGALLAEAVPLEAGHESTPLKSPARAVEMACH